jgi:hypothetical protein
MYHLQSFPNTTFDVFVASIAAAIENFVGDEIVLTSYEMTGFHSRTLPTVSVRQYIERIVTFAPCTAESFVVCLVYLERFAQKQGSLFVNPRTIHRLFLTSLLLAAKYCDDVFFNNKCYARIGGISCKEMNALEIEFLFRTKFECNVSPAKFNQFSYILYEPDAIFPAPPGLGFPCWDSQQVGCYYVSHHTLVDSIVKKNVTKEVTRGVVKGVRNNVVK